MTKLLRLDLDINQLMQKLQDGDCSESELNFLRNLYHDLDELFKDLENLKN